jgi:hypothetical protein
MASVAGVLVMVAAAAAAAAAGVWINAGGSIGWSRIASRLRRQPPSNSRTG